MKSLSEGQIPPIKRQGRAAQDYTQFSLLNGTAMSRQVFVLFAMVAVALGSTVPSYNTPAPSYSAPAPRYSAPAPSYNAHAPSGPLSTTSIPVGDYSGNDYNLKKPAFWPLHILDPSFAEELVRDFGLKFPPCGNPSLPGLGTEVIDLSIGALCPPF
ncbi:uncharacterized protein LOC119571468 [Penaeus monodon]|uniref:uncharacterized protein LOC119571468 n=1 Tax=Penaeus monodon TaxID=6687 RepID=UPI0018A753C9|nr:uncharacterized protein LOC119571468 [Penaeus monodon]